MVDYFSGFGKVLSAYIIKNAATGKSKGFGFVEFVEQKTAQEVIEIQFHVIKNVKVSCSLYLKRGKKYNKEFKTLENQIEIQKRLRRGRSCTSFPQNSDMGEDFYSAKNYNKPYSNYETNSYYYSGGPGNPYGHPNSSSYSGSYGHSNGGGSKNHLFPPSPAPYQIPNDMNTGFNFQPTTYHQQQKQQQQQEQQQLNPMPLIQPAQHNLKAAKRMSLEPSALSSFQQNKKLSKVKNRRSLMINYKRGLAPPPQMLFGGKKKKKDYKSDLPIITVNECDDLPAMTMDHFGQAPSISIPIPMNQNFPQRNSPSPNRLNFQPPQQQQQSNFEFGLGSPQQQQHHYGNHHNHQFYQNPVPTGANYQEQQEYRPHSPQPHLNYPMHQNNYIPPYHQSGEKPLKSLGSQNVETMASYGLNPSELDVPHSSGPKQRVQSFHLSKQIKTPKKKTACASSPDQKKEFEVPRLPDDDSFDENELLKECFNL